LMMTSTARTNRVCCSLRLRPGGAPLGDSKRCDVTVAPLLTNQRIILLSILAGPESGELDTLVTNPARPESVQHDSYKSSSRSPDMTADPTTWSRPAARLR